MRSRSRPLLADAERSEQRIEHVLDMGATQQADRATAVPAAAPRRGAADRPALLPRSTQMAHSREQAMLAGVERDLTFSRQQASAPWRQDQRPASSNPPPFCADKRCRGDRFVSRETAGRSIWASISQSLGCSGSHPSWPNHRTMSAPDIAPCARSMPIASMTSAPSSRSPAVSVKTNGTPLKRHRHFDQVAGGAGDIGHDSGITLD